MVLSELHSYFMPNELLKVYVYNLSIFGSMHAMLYNN